MGGVITAIAIAALLTLFMDSAAGKTVIIAIAVAVILSMVLGPRNVGRR